MRILVVSSLYPPYSIGGYEIGCRDVVEALRSRGHDVQVLTSNYGIDHAVPDDGVARWLVSEIGWDFHAPSTGLRLFHKEIHNRWAMRRMLASWQPDLVYAWSLHNISVTPIIIAQQTGLPVCFYSSDDWLAHWERRDRWLQTPHHPVRRTIKFVLDRLADAVVPIRSRTLALREIETTSAFIGHGLEMAGKPSGQVIHWGVDLARFPFRSTERPNHTRLLYVGQLIEHKGVHTAVAALDHLAHDFGITDATLTVVGRPASAAYQQQLVELAQRSAGQVTFTGPLPREQLPAVYAAHDTLIFPSIWQEPFSITLLEALASGLAVVSTATGGTPEILSHEQNALLFNTGDAHSCATQIERLISDAALYERLRLAGRATVEADFQLSRMVDQIEHHLQQVAA